MEIEFGFRKEASSIFGDIFRPVAKITIINGEIESDELVYVDSGADVTLISRSVGEYLGFKIEDSEKIQDIKGVGGKAIQILIKNAKIRIGNTTADARVAWSLVEDVPLLLGRIDVFNLFDVIFRKNSCTIFKK